MINIFKTRQMDLEKISEFEKDSWVNVSNPTNEELRTLSQKLDVPLAFLADPLWVRIRTMPADAVSSSVQRRH